MTNLTSQQKKAFRPIGLEKYLENFEFSMTNVTGICGVSGRQVNHWTKKGYIDASGSGSGKNHSYTWSDVEKIALIKQGLDAGYSLSTSVELANAFLEKQAEERERLENASVEDLQEAIANQADRIGALAKRVRGASRVSGFGLSIAETGSPDQMIEITNFFISHPREPFTVIGLSKHLNQPIEELKKRLGLLARLNFIQQIRYSGAIVYRHLPSKKNLSQVLKQIGSVNNADEYEIPIRPQVPKVSPLVKPVDITRLIDKVDWTTTDVVLLTGVTLRQVTYWRDKGLIKKKGSKGEMTIYRWRDIEKVALMKQYLDEEGLKIQEAADAAEEFLQKRDQERQDLESLSVEDLRVKIFERSGKIRELAERIRRGLRSYHHSSEIGRIAINFTDLERLIFFFESNPLSPYDLEQIELRTGQSRKSLERGLDLLYERKVVDRIEYPNGYVFRYIPH